MTCTSTWCMRSHVSCTTATDRRMTGYGHGRNEQQRPGQRVIGHGGLAEVAQQGNDTSRDRGRPPDTPQQYPGVKHSGGAASSGAAAPPLLRECDIWYIKC